MIEKEITICNQLGLHARAAAKFVRTANNFKSKITLGKGSRGGLTASPSSES